MSEDERVAIVAAYIKGAADSAHSMTAAEARAEAEECIAELDALSREQ